MADPSSEDRSDEWTADLRVRLDEPIDGYRASLHDSLDDLSEQEARFRLVRSKTTLVGLLKHLTYVEGVWFDQAVTGRSYAEIGISTTPDRSFSLTKSDTIASSRPPIGNDVNCRGKPWLRSPSMTSSRVVATAWCGPCSCRCSANSHSTPATPTSSGSRYSPDASTDPCASRAQAKRPPNAGDSGRAVQSGITGVLIGYGDDVVRCARRAAMTAGARRLRNSMQAAASRAGSV